MTGGPTRRKLLCINDLGLFQKISGYRIAIAPMYGIFRELTECPVNGLTNEKHGVRRHTTLRKIKTALLTEVK